MKTISAAVHLTGFALFLALLLLVRTASAQTSGQWVLQQKNAGAGFTLRAVTGVNSRAFGLDSSGNLTMLATGAAVWGDITGTLSAQTDLAAALALKAPLASPTFAGTVTATNLVLSASAVDTLSGVQYGVGWRDDRYTLQGPPGALQMFSTGSPLESVLYWAGRFQVGSLEAASITGEIAADLVTSGTLPAEVFRASTPQPLRAFHDAAAYAGAFGLTYGNTGPVGANEPTTPGTYFPEILVVDGDPEVNYLEGRIRTAAQLRADLDLEVGTDLQAYNAATTVLGSSIDLTSEVTGALPLANVAQGGATSGQAMAWNGTVWAPATVGVSDGDKGDITVSGSGATWSLDSSLTLTTPRIAQIHDTNGNEALILATTASAVNEVTLTNAATAGRPTLEATGGDSNISMVVKPKGTGQLRLGKATNPVLIGDTTNSTVDDIIVFNGNAAGVAISYVKSGVSLGSSALLSWTGGDPFNGSRDLALARDAASILAQRNSTTAQTFRLYETDSGSNDEYLEFAATATTNTIKPVATGTGTASKVRYYTTTTVWFGGGSGTPEAVETAGIGSLYTDTDTGTVYRKTSGTGNTGWVTP